MTENPLLNLIFKYKEVLQEHHYLSIEEREQDRIHLNEMYSELQNISQKILDSKCYLQLGRVQEDQTIRFLADDTTADQRVEMLAYILRSQCHPILFISGKNTMVLDNVQKQEKKSMVTEEKIDIETKENTPQFFAMNEVQIEPHDIEKIKEEVKKIINKNKKISYWKRHLSLAQAEILSQLASNGEVEIPLPTEKEELHGTKTCIVLKE